MIDKKQLRTFGLIWAFIFFAIGFYPTLKGLEIRQWSAYVSVSFILISLAYPALYQKIYFYQGWIKFGNVAGKINSKIIIIFLFYAIFLPIGIMLKIFRKDLLGKKLDSSAKSYFVERKEQPKEMQNQF